MKKDYQVFYVIKRGGSKKSPVQPYGAENTGGEKQ